MQAGTSLSTNLESIPAAERLPQSRTWAPSFIAAWFVIYAVGMGITEKFEIFYLILLALGVLLTLPEYLRRRRRVVLVPCNEGLAVYQNGKRVYVAHMGELVVEKMDIILKAFLVVGALVIPVAIVIGLNRGKLGRIEVLLGYIGAVLFALAAGSAAWSRTFWIQLRVPLSAGKTRVISVPRLRYYRLCR